MRTRKTDLVPEIHLAGDLLLLNLAFFIGSYFHFGNALNQTQDFLIKQYLYINLFWIAATYLFKTYNLQRVERIGASLNRLIRTCLLHLFFIFSFLVLFKQAILSVKVFTSKYLIFAFLIFSWKIFLVYFLKYRRARGYNYKKIIIAGGGREGKDLRNFFSEHPEYGFKCLGFFDDNEKYNDRLGDLSQLESFVIDNDIDEIYCSLTDLEHNRLQHLICFSDKNLVRLKMLPDIKSLGKHKVQISFYDKIPVFSLRMDPLENMINRRIKRLFDIVFSLFTIVLIFPWIFPMIAIAIKLSSKGPVFFKQLRSGRDNKPFTCYKFRTMRVNFMSHKLQATKNDSRITGVGRFLRRTSLDELPQFFNVFIGNMSVVGPRPHMLSHTEKYSEQIDKFMVRHFVKSGITGLAQVKGCRGETSNPEQMDKRVRWDLWYIENWSFYFDIQIIYLTLAKMLTGKLKGM